MAEQFETYFQRADLDRDGRISGAEAVSFFQGSGLPKNVLAQIWGYSDKKNAGYLGRFEFFNALRLVTVAQTGRELTPEIVKAALEGPAASKIPAPRINPVAVPTTSLNPASIQRPQLNNMMAPSTVMGNMPPTSYQNPGFRGPQPQLFPNAGANLQMLSSGVNQFIRPGHDSSQLSSVQMPPATQGSSGGRAATGSQLPGSNIPNFSTDWFGSRSTGPPVSATAQLSTRGFAPSNQDGFGLGPASSATTASMLRPQTASPQVALAPKTLDPLALLTQPAGQDSKALVVSGNGFSSNSGFGNDIFSVSQPKQDAFSSTLSSSIVPTTTVSPSISTGPQTRSVSIGSQSLSTTLLGDGSLQASQLPTKQNQLDIVANSMMTTSPGTSASVSQSEVPWPKMTQSNIQKYTKVFLEVDKDRDGRITGEEARNLFLSWRLPREVLKKVWDLSDQDNDGMLSISEFCMALYLMERYREGRPLPSVLPNSLKFDDALLQVTRQPSAVYGGPTWQSSPGFPRQGAPGVPPSVPGPIPQQQIQAPRHQFDARLQNLQPKVTAPTLFKQPVNQFGGEGQVALTGSKEGITDIDLKVKEPEKEIMDSREKLEYYRTKMQDLVLYKSRCENKLNEITENASASKREMEDLAKRYEEKYKQVGELASKLTVEDATFRDIHERKIELQNAIIKMEQGGSTDGLLQVRADRIQSDLEELWKALNERCKKHGLDVKSTVVVELPFGWQPGIQEGAADWDEDWDKFEDEGFILSKDVTFGSKVSVESTKSKSSSRSSALHSESASPDAADAGDMRLGINGESGYAHSEDGSERSAPGSPGRSIDDSPTHKFHPAKFDNLDASPRLNGTNSDHGGAESFFSDEKYGDESSWGAAFDAGDDTDSVWGYDGRNKEFEHGDSKQSSFFDSGDFGSNPTTSSAFGKEKSSFFADSVPGTPSFNSGPSPRSNEDQAFDNSFGRFDSFSTDRNLTRFDSIRSSTEFDQGGPFSQHNVTRFDSMHSSVESGHSRSFQSFDEADPFGTGPFKPSESSKTSSDNWRAF